MSFAQKFISVVSASNLSEEKKASLKKTIAESENNTHKIALTKKQKELLKKTFSGLCEHLKFFEYAQEQCQFTAGEKEVFQLAAVKMIEQILQPAFDMYKALTTTTQEQP